MLAITYHGSMESRLQDILYLVAYNGFAKDIGPAALCCKETLEDERIWFPYLIQQTYGPKAKTRSQILAEHMLHLNGEKMKIKMKKGYIYIWRDETRWLERMADLEKMAQKADHTEIFENILGIPDTDGIGTFVTACKNDCPGIASYYLKRGVDYNQKTDCGATPAYYALHSEYGARVFNILPRWHRYCAPEPKPGGVWPHVNFQMMDHADIHMLINNNFNQIIIHPANFNWVHNIVPNESEPVKPKKIKSKLYKQQFGPKR